MTEEKKTGLPGFIHAQIHFVCVFLKLVFKKLYKNSGKEISTLRLFREKLQCRNVTQDLKPYEEYEQLFRSVGKCFTSEYPTTHTLLKSTATMVRGPQLASKY